MSDPLYLKTALLMRGQQVSQMIHVAAELGLADRIGEGRDVGELALEVGAVPGHLSRLLRALSAFGIFSVRADGTVHHTPMSGFLRRDSVPTLHYASRFWGMPSMWATWGEVTHAVRTGEPAFAKALGMQNWEYLKSHPDEGAIFDAFMQHSPDDRHAAVSEAYDFGAAKVVDVGGGNGGLIAAVLSRYPRAKGVLADQPGVVAAASQVLGELATRCEIVAANFFESVPAGGDIYSMAQIMHDWSDVKCLEILRTVRAAMAPGSRILIIERVLDDDPEKQDVLTLLADMQMMALFEGGKERTVSEYASLLAASGFGEPRVIATRSPFSIVESKPV